MDGFRVTLFGVDNADGMYYNHRFECQTIIKDLEYEFDEFLRILRLPSMLEWDMDARVTILSFFNWPWRWIEA